MIQLCIFYFLSQIRLGNLKFPIGFLQYAKREPNLVVAGLMGSGLAIFCILLVVFVVVWMKKTHRGIFRKKTLRDGNFSVRYTPGSQDPFALDNRDAIYRLNENRKLKLDIDGLTHWGWDKMATILQMTFSNAFSWMKECMNLDRNFTGVFT